MVRHSNYLLDIRLTADSISLLIRVTEEWNSLQNIAMDNQLSFVSRLKYVRLLVGTILSM